ncbi:MAG: plasmid pRiA4b ORF-3 family protein [Candidatus Nanopelagicales bacterium]|nr:plasmid pRiA4b ORF-3 family protein [Candidatus Nanopelagicales bacterium]
MQPTDDPNAELSRRLQEATVGMDSAQISDLARQLLDRGARIARAHARPELRRPPLGQPGVLRVRAELAESDPLIWRTLDVRNDISLVTMHRALQAAFSWQDYHLYRFALGGDPFDVTSQVFLCAQDLEEGAIEDQGGVPVEQVRIDELLQQPGDTAAYIYDYGDNWDVLLTLEDVQPTTERTPALVAVAGERAAPPEDSDGAADAASLAVILDDPERFDLDEINRALSAEADVLSIQALQPRLVYLLGVLRHTDVGKDCVARAQAVVTQPVRIEPAERAAALHAFRWFLDRAAAGGIPLTSAGYMKPVDVEAASTVVPGARDWIGKRNREDLTAPVYGFRLLLQDLRLLRKFKGSLLLTRLAVTAQQDPSRLWELIAGQLVPDDGFERDATLLLILFAATSPDEYLSLRGVAQAMSMLGWRYADGPVGEHHLRDLLAWVILCNVGEQPQERAHDRGPFVSRAAAALAVSALRPTE